MYKWVVLLTSTDYYECVQTIKEVHANTETEAEQIIINDYNGTTVLNAKLHSHQSIYVFGPFLSPEDIELHNRLDRVMQAFRKGE